MAAWSDYEMNKSKESKSIVLMFTRYVGTGDDSELAGLSIEKVKAAEAHLGHLDLNAEYRIAMRKWIVDTQAKERRAKHVITAVGISLLVAGLGALFFI